MTNQMIRAIGAALVAALWLGLAGFAWFGPTKEKSDAENRYLAQMPELSVDAVFATDEQGQHPFMSGFEKFTLDQFPLRDSFRSVKAMFHTYVLGNKDNNGYFYKDGYLAVQDRELNLEAVQDKLDVLNQLYQKLLKGNGGRYYVAMVPDKSYYLANQYGYPSMDYAELERMMRDSLSWGQYIDITPSLDLTDYYRTDTHWRQEKLIPTAQLLCQAMGVTGPGAEEFTQVKIDQPFYGVYHAQAALPVPPDTMYIMDSPMFADVTVILEGKRRDGLYDPNKLGGNDPYNIYLHGAKTGDLVIENPNARTDKQLIIFRDSFGSSIAPLFVGDYAKITLVDLRVTDYRALRAFVDLDGADVLVLMSSLAMNNADEAFLG